MRTPDILLTPRFLAGTQNQLSDAANVAKNGLFTRVWRGIKKFINEKKCSSAGGAPTILSLQVSDAVSKRSRSILRSYAVPKL